MGSPYAGRNSQQRREEERQIAEDIAYGRAYRVKTHPRAGGKGELKYRTDAEMEAYLGPEKYKEYQLRQKFGVGPEYKTGQGERRRKTGPSGAELQEYEQGIQGVVKSQQAMMSSMRARMAASGHSQEQIEMEIGKLRENFDKEVAYMYTHGGTRMKDIFDPTAALVQRKKYYEQKAGTLQMNWGEIAQEGGNWQKWW